MTEREFAKKAIRDKNFLFEACRNIPDELLDERENKSAEETTPLGVLLGIYFAPASKAMGYDCDEATLIDEFLRQTGELKRFAAIRFAARFITAFVKTGKIKKK